MASVEYRNSSARITFRFDGTKYHHTVGTTDKAEIQGVLGTIEESLRLVKRGRLKLPLDGDLATFLVSGGEISSRPSVPTTIRLAEAIAEFKNYREFSSIEDNTRSTEKIQLRHLERILGENTPLRSIKHKHLQDYVNVRSRDTGRRGKPLSHVTILKEIMTLAHLWNHWAMQNEYVDVPCPSKGLLYKKRNEKPPFKTKSQIEQEIALGGDVDVWDSLYLDLTQISESLDILEKQSDRPGHVYPMFVLAAHTGARRSEMLRSEICDFNIDNGTVHLREKKKDKSKRLTFRSVPISDRLMVAIQQWFDIHPGGRYTFCQSDGSPLTEDMAKNIPESAFENSDWSCIRGWHVFRHSFASNCAAQGTDPRIIDSWMGHQTNEMRERYRHLFPDQAQQALKSVFA